MSDELTTPLPSATIDFPPLKTHQDPRPAWSRSISPGGNAGHQPAKLSQQLHREPQWC